MGGPSSHVDNHRSVGKPQTGGPEPRSVSSISPLSLTLSTNPRGDPRFVWEANTFEPAHRDSTPLVVGSTGTPRPLTAMHALAVSPREFVLTTGMPGSVAARPCASGIRRGVGVDEGKGRRANLDEGPLKGVKGLIGRHGQTWHHGSQDACRKQKEKTTQRERFMRDVLIPLWDRFGKPLM